MREIKFRGRSIEDGKTWYTGQYYIEYSSMPHPIRTPKSLSPPSNTHWIVFPSFADWGMPREMQRVQIDHETLGQFTGLKDKNGKEIYEGDIVEIRMGGMGTGNEYPIVWDSEDLTYKVGHAMLGSMDVEVIGNIYSNPELLK